MARTIEQIQQAIIASKSADPTLSSLSSNSNTAIWLLCTYIISVSQWVLENLFDAHKGEVSGIIAGQKPHTLQWYVNMARQFQYGVALPDGSDTYAAPTTDATIAIIQFAAAVELTNLVRVKVATLSSGVLAAISGTQLTAFSAYMQLIKDAGVRMQVTSGAPDVLQVALHIFYDPLVINAAGARIDGTSTTPVRDAVNGMLNNLPFNGLFVLNNLIATLQAIDGVVIGEVVSAQANYASLPFSPVTVEYTPDAGYMILDETFFNTNIIYTAHGPI